jgi:histidinol-phosphate aminotransferase
LRLGYLAASPELITALRLVRLPYHLSSLTQAAAVAALEHADEMQAAVAELRHRRDELEIWLKSQNLETTPSDANFVMFGRFSDRHQVWQNLADQGVLIREVGPPGWLRVSVGTEAETQMFQTALANLLAGAEIVPAGQ